MKTPILISSKFAGKAAFLDTLNGVFWETLPDMTAHGERLQQALVGKGSQLDKARNRINNVCLIHSACQKPQPESAGWQTSATPRESSAGTSSTN